MSEQTDSDFREHAISWSDEKVARLWDYYSKHPPFSEAYFSKAFGDQLLRHALLPSRSLHVLDFGCGPGHMWDHISRLRHNWRYSALDFSPRSVEEVKRKAEGHPQFVEAMLVRRLPSEYQTASFDAVLLIEVLEHLSDTQMNATLEEVARLLTRGGQLVVSTPNQEDLGASTRFCPDCGAIFHEWQHVRSWSPQALMQVVTSYGFDLMRIRELDFRARGVVRRFGRWIRKYILGRNVSPHLIAVFAKR